MANFIARAIAPGPRMDLAATSPVTGTPLRSTTYRGLIDVSVDSNKGPPRTVGTLSVVVPDPEAARLQLPVQLQTTDLLEAYVVRLGYEIDAVVPLAQP